MNLEKKLDDLIKWPVMIMFIVGVVTTAFTVTFDDF